jgi:hypothetical protein
MTDFGALVVSAGKRPSVPFQPWIEIPLALMNPTSFIVIHTMTMRALPTTDFFAVIEPLHFGTMDDRGFWCAISASCLTLVFAAITLLDLFFFAW